MFKYIASYLNLLFLIGSLAAGEAFAKCDPLEWKMGMSPEEVAGITECGPYETFSNGDLETYKGVFDGKEENFQFFFEEHKLRRIGIYLYEGKDPAAAAKEWLALYGTLIRLFGKIETPYNDSTIANDTDRESFTAWRWSKIRAKPRWHR